MTLVLCIGILLLLPLVDLGLKGYIETHISKEQEIPVCKGRVLVRYVQNEGMALNFMEKHPRLVRWMSLLAVVPMGIYYVVLLGDKGKAAEKISLSLLLGGAISNLYDRFVRKYVVDYFGFRMKRKYFRDITYNFGDLGIFAGAVGLLLSTWFHRN